MADRKLRVALAGAGNISPYHLAAWQQAGAEVAAICDPVRARAEQRAHEFAIPATFTDYREMLAAVRPDAVDIASPMDTHSTFVLAALAAGAHALCQKPLCGTLAEAHALVAALPRSGPRLMVHENWRFRPWYRAIARWLGEERLGQVRQVRLAWLNSGLLPDVNGELPIFARQPYMAKLRRLLVGEVLIHHLDTLRFLVGPLTVRGAVLAHGCSTAAGESTASILLAGPRGEAIFLEGNMMARGYPARPLDRCEILGDAGRVLLDAGVLTLESARPERLVYDLDAAYQESFDGTIAHFTECLRGGREFETSPGDNLHTLALVEEVYASAAGS